MMEESNQMFWHRADMFAHVRHKRQEIPVALLGKALGILSTLELQWRLQMQQERLL